MNLSIGYSTCPNDTFIFGAMVHGMIDTGKYTFNVHLDDVEALNKLASSARLDITKLSCRALFDVSNDYGLLRSGGAMGLGCGPLLIARKPIALSNLSGCRLAIPGEKTTAHFMLNFILPNLPDKKAYLFSEIEDAVLNGEVDAGLIIHENRFTYAARGLHKLLDLGEEWEKQTQSPIPLGCIGILRKYGAEVAADLEKLIRQSVQYAWKNPDLLRPYIKSHAQSMEDEVIDAHIALYVNHFTENLGTSGEQALRTMAEVLNYHAPMTELYACP
jgi:1,4-dihydroxy-6-naphthoate synthase